MKFKILILILIASSVAVGISLQDNSNPIVAEEALNTGNSELCNLEVIKCEGEAELSPTGLVATQEGVCSWYDFDLRTKDQICRSDDCWSKNHLTMASRDYPRGTIVKVVNIENNKSVEVLVNDYVENPKVICDLSSFAFKKIAELEQGIINVKIYKK